MRFLTDSCAADSPSLPNYALPCQQSPRAEAPCWDLATGHPYAHHVASWQEEFGHLRDCTRRQAAGVGSGESRSTMAKHERQFRVARSDVESLSAPSWHSVCAKIALFFRQFSFSFVTFAIRVSICPIFGLTFDSAKSVIRFCLTLIG